MKKLILFSLLMLLPSVAMGQILYENDFTGITEFTGWYQFADSQTDGKVEVDPDGVAITVGIQTGQLWQPEIMVVPDGSFNLKEDGNYRVYITAKFPSDGTLQINMGTWSANDQAQFPVTATGDFQTVECDFSGWSVDADGAHLLFMCGDFKGTTIVKSIEVYDMAGGEPVAKSELLYENDYTGITEFTGWSQFGDEQTDGKVDVDPDGVAITVGIQTGQLWQPQIMVVPDGSFNLEEGSKYTVVITAKFPTAGTLQFNMGTWSANDQDQFPIEANDDFQEVVCEFPDWSVDAEGAHLIFQCGDFKGTTILKKIEIWKGDALIREKWNVVGDEDLLGVDWDATKNKMFSNDAEHYKLTNRNILLSKGTYHYKVIKDEESYPNTNASLVIDEDAIYTVIFEFNANTKEVSATATKTTGWTIAGDEALLGAKSNLTQNKMITNDGENYTLTKTDLMLPKGTYEFKVYNNSSMQESYPNTNATLVIDENAQYTVIFTFNSNTKEVSATATKTDGIFYNYIPKGKIAEVIQNPNKYKGNIIIPEKVTHDGIEYTVKKIGDNAFQGCSGLTSITIPNSVTSIDCGAFAGCSGLTSITIPNSVSSIENSSFANCSGLTSVTIPNSVTSIGNSAFYYCTGLTSITIPNSVSSIDNYAFSGCSGLTYITIPNSVTSIGSCAFQDCSGLTTITIPNSVTSIGSCAFWGCSGLTSFTIPNSVTSIDDSAFQYCSGLTSITIPNSVTSIGGCAFEGCSSLASITIPNSVTSINNQAFSNCSGLTSFTIPNSVNFIYSSTFSGCSGLTSIIIPNNVTYIGGNAFSGCSGLSSVTIGSGVIDIDYNAFANCTYLTDVYCMAENVPSTDTSAFDGSYIDFTSLHVPASAINAYKTTAPWSGFGEFKTLSGEAIETKKCATPTISFENGEIIFSCETEGVEYVSNISAPDAKAYYDGRLKLTYKYTVTVYATKSGYENSDTATAEFTASGKLGDLTGDGKVNVADHVKLTEIIMSEGE